MPLACPSSGRLRFGGRAPSRKRSSDLPRACPSTGGVRFGGWAPSRKRSSDLPRRAPISRSNVEDGLAVGLLRASAHPCCARGRRLGRCGGDRRGHSHSMVLGGLEEMSETTPLTPLTSLVIPVEV